MRIQMIQTLADHRQCFVMGETYDLDEARAKKLLAAKLAKPAKPEPKPEDEKK